MTKLPITLGLEVFLNERSAEFRNIPIGLICNPATVDHSYRPAVELFARNPDLTVAALFGPQHGIHGETQDNMIEWESFLDARTGVMSYSLYGKVRKPTEKMLQDVDVLVFDLQDVGTRVYTFIYTMALAMEAAKSLGKRMIILDRPNPIGDAVEGSLLERGHESFVGMYPIPMRHGMTVGELARMFNEEFGVDCDLEVVSMKNYRRDAYLDQTDAPWVLPSPNMPTIDAAIVYPGAVLLEGTKVSEGRGGTRPFEICGAPYVDSHELATALNGLQLPGVYFRPHSFQPTFQKFKGALCHGVQLHVLCRKSFRPVITGVAVIKTIRDLWPDEFEWQEQPYEYVYDRAPFDVIAGTFKLREQIESGVSLSEIADSWKQDETEFLERRAKYLLY